MALESIGVFYSYKNPEEFCFLPGHQICQGNIEELHSGPNEGGKAITEAINNQSQKRSG